MALRFCNYSILDFAIYKLILFFVCFFILFTSLYSQHAELDIGHDDGSEFSGRYTSLFLNQRYVILYSVGMRSKLLAIKATNGIIEVDTADGNGQNHYVRPMANDKLILTAQIELYKKDIPFDTIEVNQEFNILVPPEFGIRVIKDEFRKNRKILVQVFNKSNNKPYSKRYKIGRLGYLNVFDEKDNFIDSMDLLGNEYIDFGTMWQYFSDKKIKPGYRIEINFCMRDKKTDLLIPVDVLSYKIK